MTRPTWIAVAVLALGCAGCSGDGGAAPPDAAAALDAPDELGTLVITPPTFSMPLGLSLQLAAAVAYQDGRQVDVTDSVVWSSDAPAVVAVDAAGLVTATGIGTAAIGAALAERTAHADATVGGPVVVGLAVTPHTGNVTAGCAPLQLTATATLSDATTQDVTATAEWSSANPAVALVSSDGRVAGVNAGGPIAISAVYAGTPAAAQVTVTAIGVIGLEIKPATATVTTGATQAFRAKAIDASGSTEDVTGDAGLTWSSADETVAAIDAGGVATAVAGGMTAIGATLVVCSATFIAPPAILTVDAPEPVLILVEPRADTVEVGAAIALHAQMVWSDRTLTDITELATWTSDSPDIAKVSDLPGEKGLVTGIAAGKAGIIVTAPADLGGTDDTSAITVVDPTPPPP